MLQSKANPAGKWGGMEWSVSKLFYYHSQEFMKTKTTDNKPCVTQTIGGYIDIIHSD